MSSAHSTIPEQSSEFPTWVVLLSSGLALLIFFGWILKDLSALDPLSQRMNLPVQPSSEIESVSETSDSAASVNIPAYNGSTDGQPAGSNTSSEMITADARPKSTPAPDTLIRSSAQSIQLDSERTAVGTLKHGQSDTRQTRQSTGQIIAEPGNSVEFSTIEPNIWHAVSDKDENSAHVDRTQPETGSAKPETLAGTPFNPTSADQETVGPASDVPASKSDRQAASQEAAVPAKELHDAEWGGATAISVDSESVFVTQSDETAEINKTDPAVGSSANTVRVQAQRPSADLGALRQLLAEAAAINGPENGQLRAQRKQREARESLGILSERLRFAPGSKIAGASMNAALIQIRNILADYPKTSIEVIVATNESGDGKQDLLLSQERGRALIARFVKEGLDFSRFSLKALTDAQLPANSHSIEIRTSSKS